MKIKKFLNELEHDRVQQAIISAEKDTSCDIVLFISHRSAHDPLAAANHQFRKLRLETATDKNSLLIFVAPQTQKFAIVGGTALHDKMGESWWNHLIGILTRHFKEAHYTDGLVATIEEAGKAVKRHFPARNTDRTGQSDIVEE